VLVVFDTNALLLPFTQGTDLDGGLENLFGTVEWIIPSSILGELKMLANGGEGTLARNAKAALRLAQRARIESTALPGDDGLLEVARRLKAAVVTNDRALQAEAATSGLIVVVAREQGRLALRRSASG
jgi:rRNA-processing protein FCF1